VLLTVSSYQHYFW